MIVEDQTRRDAANVGTIRRSLRRIDLRLNRGAEADNHVAVGLGHL